MAEIRHLRINVDLNSLAGGLQRSIQRTADLVRLGLSSADQPLSGSPWTPASGIHYFAASPRDLDSAELRTDFRVWVVSNGFREIVEQAQAFIEQVRRVCAALSFEAGSLVAPDEWNRRVNKDARRFHRLGLPDKLAELESEFPTLTLPLSTQHLKSINRCRNCLVHRGGVVGSQDVNEDQKLIVTWLRSELVLKSADGAQPVQLPHVVGEDERLALRFTQTRRTFNLGEQVTLSAEEFGEICWTLVMFAQEMRAAVSRHADAFGISGTNGETLKT